MDVPARVSLATLGVEDLARSTAFYQALGWPLSVASVPGEVSFFETAGALLALYGRDALAGDAGLEPAPAGAFLGASLATNLEGRAEVDNTFARVRTAGGEIVKPPTATDWGGYSGYFRDPDGHLWEVAHNPAWPIGPDGLPTLPSPG